MSKPKEPHYFSVSKRWGAGVEYHNSLFAADQDEVKYFGESSTTYCIYEPAIQRIRSCLDRPKIIILLRNPVERVISHYKWLYSLGLEKRPILDAVEQSGFEFDPDNSLQGNFSAYLRFSAYSKYVPLWQEIFGNKNVLLLESVSLRNDPENVLDAVFDFLELPKADDLELVNKNITTDVRPINKPGWIRLARKIVPRSIKSFAISNSVTGNAWRYLTAQKKIIPPDINEADRDILEMILEDDCHFYDRLFTR